MAPGRAFAPLLLQKHSHSINEPIQICTCSSSHH